MPVIKSNRRILWGYEKQISNFWTIKFYLDFDRKNYVINYNQQNEGIYFWWIRESTKSNFEYWDSVSGDYFLRMELNLSRILLGVEAIY